MAAGPPSRPPHLVWLSFILNEADAVTAQAMAGLVPACAGGLLQGPDLLLRCGVGDAGAGALATPPNVAVAWRELAVVTTAAGAAMGGVVAGEVNVLATAVTAAAAATSTAAAVAVTGAPTSAASASVSAATRQGVVTACFESIEEVCLALGAVLTTAPLAAAGAAVCPAPATAAAAAAALSDGGAPPSHAAPPPLTPDGLSPADVAVAAGVLVRGCWPPPATRASSTTRRGRRRRWPSGC